MKKVLLATAMAGLSAGAIIASADSTALAYQQAYLYPGEPRYFFRDVDVNPATATLRGNIIIDHSSWSTFNVSLSGNPGEYTLQMGSLCNDGWHWSPWARLNKNVQAQYSCPNSTEPLKGTFGAFDDIY